MGCGEDWLEVGGAGVPPLEPWEEQAHLHAMQCLPCRPACTLPTLPRGKESSVDLGPPVSGSGVATQRPDISHVPGSPETQEPTKSKDLFPVPHGLSFITEFLLLSLPSIHSAFTPSDSLLGVDVPS